MLHTRPEDDPSTDSTTYYVTELFNALTEANGVEDSQIARLEWAFLPVLDHRGHKPKYLHHELARSPEFFVEVVSLVFNAEGQEPRGISPETQMRAEHAWYLLESWRTLPGMNNGAIDGNALKDWVRHTRELLATAGRAAIGDERIGYVLSGSPFGEDGAWPHPFVCDIIEDTASNHLEIGLEVSVRNSRGVFTKSLGEGGNQERQLADRYTKYAKARRDQWPRTAALLRSIADRYLADAREEDARAELREDLW
jgi:hypothetical protein